jgi:small-conductance mechanosensitive channel
MGTLIEAYTEHALRIGFRFGIALLIYLAFHLAGSVLSRLMSGIAKKLNSGREYVVRLLGKIIKVTLIVIGAVTALGTLGVNVSAIVASLGLTGFALGFALKDALSNILAGILILFYQPFRAGDRIAMMAFEGNVIRIDLRYTMLDGPDGKRILIPNSNLFNNVVVIVSRG